MPFVSYQCAQEAATSQSARTAVKLYGDLARCIGHALWHDMIALQSSLCQLEAIERFPRLASLALSVSSISLCQLGFPGS